jgi:hypothetical protein
MAELIREDVDLSLIESQIEEVQEGMTKIKNFYIHGPFLQAEVVNGNKRVYPRMVLEREVESHIKTKIAEKRALGELGHPPTSEINLDRVSHLITELRMEGNTAIGKAKILDTPTGKIAKSLMESGVKLGVSSRGLGSLKNGIVQNDFKLICVDIVSDPSGPGCWVQAINEKKEWVLENGILTEREVGEIVDDIDKIVIENKYSKEDQQAAFLKLFQDAMNKIASK